MHEPSHFLFSDEVPAPCFLIDEEQLEKNCAILDQIQKKTHVRILLALKAFAAWSLFPKLSRAFSGPLYGTCASSVDEAILGKEKFGGEVHVFSAGYDEESIRALIGVADCISFNSIAQFRRFYPILASNAPKIECGIRINPEYSESTHAIYDPCHPSSRLGVRIRDYDPHVFEEGVSGLHFHTLCEQNASALVHTLNAVYARFASELPKCRWFNMGGGHHITRDDYDRELLSTTLLDVQTRTKATCYLEPGEAVALNCGWLSATVLDIVVADTYILILNISVTCHMPDVLEMPYRPKVFYKNKGKICEAKEEQSADGVCVKIAGNSCLAGDVIPFTYTFHTLPKIGDRLLFADMAIYSMVKTTTFNGIRLPSIARFCGENLSVMRTFGYEDFKMRLS